MPWRRSEVGTLWSATAIVASGRRTFRPARRKPSNACGLVTSCTQMPVDVEHAGSVRQALDDVGRENLVEQGARLRVHGNGYSVAACGSAAPVTGTDTEVSRARSAMRADLPLRPRR